jgi:hypothetical protein
LVVTPLPGRRLARTTSANATSHGTTHFRFTARR